MNKVITINLNGRAYQLEEAGFDVLRRYLDEASTRLADDPGKAEIIADLEQAIAEKCDRMLNPHKTVIATAEIENILQEMGPVEGNGHTKDATTSTDTQSGSSVKRLYRIKEGSMLWGVCTGLAAFFDLDVTLVRIVFVLLTLFTGGGFCLAYGLMTLIIPEADTMQEKAAAHGEPFNAQELVNRAKQEYAHLAERFASKHEQHLKWKHDTRRQRKQWKYANYPQGRPPYRPNPLLGLLRGVLAIAWILALFSLITTGAVFGWVLPAGIPIWLAIILLFVLYQAVTGPMRAQHYSVGDHTYSYTEWDGFGDGLTILFLTVAFGWAYLHVPQVYYFVHHPILGTEQAITQIKTLLHI